MTVTQAEAVEYIHFLAGVAKGLNMTIGLKNSLQILSSVSDVISFAVNEQCAFYSECYWYKDHLASGKPVYQIEYPTPLPAAPSARATACGTTPPTPSGLSLVFKNMSLDGYVEYCDGSVDTTETKPGSPNAPPPRPPKTTVRPHPTTSTRKPTSSKTTRPTSSQTTSRTTTTSRPPWTSPTFTTSHTTSSRMPTSPSSSPTSGGCISKHWDQCGGQDWK